MCYICIIYIYIQNTYTFAIFVCELCRKYSVTFGVIRLRSICLSTAAGVTCHANQSRLFVMIKVNTDTVHMYVAASCKESRSGTENEICAIIDNISKYLCSMQAFRRAVYKSPADSPFTIHHSPSALPLSSLDQYKWASEL